MYYIKVNHRKAGIITLKRNSLSKARLLALQWYRWKSFISLENEKGVKLPITKTLTV